MLFARRIIQLHFDWLRWLKTRMHIEFARLLETNFNAKTLLASTSLQPSVPPPVVNLPYYTPQTLLLRDRASRETSARVSMRGCHELG
jgi:hypothetical protein